MTKILTIILLFCTSILVAQTIAPKKCNTCGKPLSQCQYKGRHPKQTSKTNSQPVLHSNPTSCYENVHECVDLGLSVKWATCNVGANSPSDYGEYYAWGETNTKSRYDWDNCFDCLDSYNSGLVDSWIIYKIGGQTQITPISGHDTARENWGGKWRMPTEAEIEELCKKCTWIWTTKNDHKGYLVTGKNGNSIFLPAAGWRFGSVFGSVGIDGSYWSSTLSSSVSKSANLFFSSRALGTDGNFRSYAPGTSVSYRSYGHSVRPVIDL